MYIDAKFLTLHALWGILYDTTHVAIAFFNFFLVSNHRIEHNHDMNWGEASVLDIERSYTKRIVSEMVHIKKQSYGLNKQSDTDLLPQVYLPIIDSLP